MYMKKERTSTLTLTFISVMMAITLILAFTPIGMIRLPLVSFTIAHLPAIIAAIILGLYPGLMVALTFGLSSLFLAATSPTGLLDPFFVNPLISVLPRLLIPITTYFTYQFLSKVLRSFNLGAYVAIIISVIIGNLTNTFGVYTMLYILYANQIMEKSGTPAITLIIGAISTTTLIKTLGIVIITTPVVYALQKIRK